MLPSGSTNAAATEAMATNSAMANRMVISVCQRVRA